LITSYIVGLKLLDGIHCCPNIFLWEIDVHFSNLLWEAAPFILGQSVSGAPFYYSSTPQFHFNHPLVFGCWDGMGWDERTFRSIWFRGE
jgi:hypothetical protein